MVELLAAMVVLVVGLLAIFAMFQTSTNTIRRATKVSTASALADKQMENYRAVLYSAIGFTSSALSGTDSTYAGDTAYRAAGTNQVNQAVTLASSSFSPTQTLTGADGRSYRVDAYISWLAVSSGRNVKQVTIVVRDTVTPTKTWTRTSSLFDESTGS